MFEIQRFSTNDTITSSREGNFVVSFYDGDNRTLKIDNPRADLTATEINAVVEAMKTNQPLIGDKAGASIVGAEKFEILEKTEVKLDLS